MKKERIVVAMSGGVDSSVSAALLKAQGYEVIGITMCFNLADSGRRRPGCCGLEGIEDARRVAHKLGIRHYVLNMQKELETWVIKDFLKEYIGGRTPNPCVRCNQYIKFGALLKKAFSLDAKLLATGHYARIMKSPSPQPPAPSYVLKKAKDMQKDQSYFLYRLNQEQLKHTLFPLGNYTKGEVRNLAKDFSLPVADKLASQDICFLPNVDYRRFIEHRLHRLSRSTIFYIAGSRFAGKNTDYTDIMPGPVVDSQGNVLGRHKGIAFYTIGQREGLGIAKGHPLYITNIDAKNNEIVVGTKEEACRSEFLVQEPHFILEAPKKKVEVKVKIRYNHKEEPAEVAPIGNKIRVKFLRPQFAITPGQSAVFYDRDTVLGGGIIDKALDKDGKKRI